jgi:flagellin-like hook-associated protein FlgL
MPNPITGIPSSRVSDAFIRERLLAQVQHDQTALYRTQSQMSTGHRFQTPSEDPVAAMRVMGLQRLLQRKTQMTANQTTSSSYLSATDTALSSVSDLTSELRALTVGAIGTTATDDQRRAAAQQADQIATQLLDTGNQQFRGRYLFAGSENAVRPFGLVAGRIVEYYGNEQHLSSYADIDQLFNINLTGSQVFGAISEPVRGTQDLDPVLTYDTRLADLRGGQGISRGSIAVSDGNNTSIVDLSTATTVGDVARMIKANPPSGRQIEVEINAKTLTLRLAPAPAITTNFSIREVGSGMVAAELGVLRPDGVGSLPIESRDLDPTLRGTAALDDILGARARAALHSTGSDNDILIEADVPGAQTAAGIELNNVTIEFVDDPAVTVGNEVVHYDAAARRIVVDIDSGRTQAQHVVAAIEARHDGDLFPFHARLDPVDELHGGAGLVTAGASGATRDGAGEAFDRAAGLQIVNKDQTFTVSLQTTQTVEDVLNVLNGAGAGLVAEINARATGIDVRSAVSGCDFAIGENGGRTAAQLGLRTFTRDTRLDDLNFARGVDDYPGYTNAIAEAAFDSTAANGDLLIRARNRGATWNGFAVSISNTAGPEQVVYDRYARTLDIQIRSGVTTASEVIALLRDAPGAGEEWEAVLDNPPNDGSGVVDLGAAATAGGDDAGADFYVTRTDGVRLAIDVYGKETIGDVLDLINNHPGNAGGSLVAQLAAYGNGIELVDGTLAEGQLQVTRNPLSQAAYDLGLMAAGSETSAAAVQTGVPAATVTSAAMKSGLIFAAKTAGNAHNGVRVIFDPAAPPGPPAYDLVAKTLTFPITAGVTTAADLKTALEASPLASLFGAEFDPADTSHNNGSGPLGSSAGNFMTCGADSHATVTVRLPGADNDMVFRSLAAFPAADATDVQFIAGPAGTPLTINHTGNVLSITYDSVAGATAQNVVAAFVGNPDFAVALDPLDYSPNDGSGAVDATGGTGVAMTGGSQTLTGSDVHPLETEGLFNALLRIRNGLLTNNQYELQRALEQLDNAVTNAQFSRSELNAEQQSLDVLQSSQATDNIELQKVLSVEYDADLAAVISEFSGRQAAFQASLRATALISQLTLLDYL